MIPIIPIIFAIGIPAFAIWKNGKEPLKRPYLFSIVSFTFCAIAAIMETSLDKGTQRKTTENELPSLTQCTA